MHPKESQFPKSHVKVHPSLSENTAPDTWDRQVLRGAMRRKDKLDSFQQTDERRQSMARENDRETAEHNHQNAGDIGTWHIDGENPPKFKP